jgi:hypothetical protein
VRESIIKEDKDYAGYDISYSYLSDRDDLTRRGIVLQTYVITNLHAVVA